MSKFTRIYKAWPDYPHIYAVCVARRGILYINTAGNPNGLVQLDVKTGG